MKISLYTGEALPRSSESASAMASWDFFGAPTMTGSKEQIKSHSWGKGMRQRKRKRVGGLEVLNHKCTAHILKNYQKQADFQWKHDHHEEHSKDA